MLIILRNAKVVKHSDNTMAERGEFDIDNQKDMTQYSGSQMLDSSQICDKEVGVDSTNKEVLNMMHVMFSHLEEKLAENQKQLKESQERMSINLEEKLAENQKSQERMCNHLEEKLIESQENLKISMNNSLNDSVEKIEEAMKCLEDRKNINVTQQREEFNVKVQEVEDRMIQRKMKETDWVIEYVDN